LQLRFLKARAAGPETEWVRFFEPPGCELRFRAADTDLPPERAFAGNSAVISLKQQVDITQRNW
jgi:hypothetical protein